MNNALVCEKCCAALGNITLNGFKLNKLLIRRYDLYFFFVDENVVMAGKSDIINVIIKAMGIHINSPGVCEYGCVALSNIASDGNLKKRSQFGNSFHNLFVFLDKNEIKAGKAGAIEVVIKAIGTHTSNKRICEKGCRALSNLTSNGKKKNK